METINFDNRAEVMDDTTEEAAPVFYEPSESDKELTAFVVDHTDRWREYRDQNYAKDWEKYERIWRGIWAASDKGRESERSKIISPATQQAIETRHAEIMEAVFGQSEFFDIDDDINDQNGALDIEKLKKQLMEDFACDKVRKAVDQVALLGEIYGSGIAEIIVGKEKYYKPMEMPVPQAPQMLGQSPQPQQVAYGTAESDRISVKLSPVNPKNFLFDPNGTSIDDCMGVAIEKYVSIHKIAQGIASGKYLNVDIGALYESDELEPTQQTRNFEDDKVKILTYYGLAPKEYVTGQEEFEEILPNEGEPAVAEQLDDYADMVETIIVIANGGLLLKKEENPYMMKDRPVLLYQADTVPNRLLGRGTVEKAYNMQAAIDGSMRSHMDALALTVAPMVAADATRLPRGAKFEVKPGKLFLTNGAPNEILSPFKFGTNDGQAMVTAKEFERMLLMATGTIDSNGTVSQVARDGQSMDMATATMIKKYKRTLVNMQEDFIIPFVKKAAWRYMQFDPQRYPSVDVKFIPTATLGIIAREYENKQLAFLMQTLGANSPLTPILMRAIVKNSGLTDRETMLQQLEELSKPNPQMQEMQMQSGALDLGMKQAEVNKVKAETEKINVEVQLAPKVAEAKIISALTNNLEESDEDKSFQKRVEIANLALAERDIDSNERIAEMQAMTSLLSKRSNSAGNVQ